MRDTGRERAEDRLARMLERELERSGTLRAELGVQGSAREEKGDGEEEARAELGRCREAAGARSGDELESTIRGLVEESGELAREHAELRRIAGCGQGESLVDRIRGLAEAIARGAGGTDRGRQDPERICKEKEACKEELAAMTALRYEAVGRHKEAAEGARSLQGIINKAVGMLWQVSKERKPSENRRTVEGALEILVHGRPLAAEAAAGVEGEEMRDGRRYFVTQAAYEQVRRERDEAQAEAGSWAAWRDDMRTLTGCRDGQSLHKRIEELRSEKEADRNLLGSRREELDRVRAERDGAAEELERAREAAGCAQGQHLVDRIEALEAEAAGWKAKAREAVAQGAKLKGRIGEAAKMVDACIEDCLDGTARKSKLRQARTMLEGEEYEAGDADGPGTKRAGREEG